MYKMETTKPPTNSSNSNSSGYHHQRAPRTPESYFNVPESIALLNIVKSERIQSAFQSNRKNHASVWEMVAEVLNRFSARKRSAKQCCNRYENLKKIYTQLKKNPERHVRRNWPYMFLFKEIEEQRGECWGSNGNKRLALIAKNHKDLSYYQRRRQEAVAAEYGVLLNKEALAAQAQAQAQHQTLLQSLANSTDSNSNQSKLERFMPNHFVETQLTEGEGSAGGVYGDLPLHLQAVQVVQAAAHARKENEMLEGGGGGGGGGGGHGMGMGVGGGSGGGGNGGGGGGNVGSGNLHMNVGLSVNASLGHMGMETNDVAMNGIENGMHMNGDGMNGTTLREAVDVRHAHEKNCNAALNLQNADNNISMKSEPLSEGEFNPDDITLMQTNYNGAQNFYPHNIDPNMLHPDVIVDTDNISDCTSAISPKSKRKLSTSTDGAESTNYELIEYLKRREKRDEELLKRMDDREERLLNLLERTVVAIETLATQAQKSSITNCEPKNP